MALTTATFRVILSSTIPMVTGCTGVEGEGFSLAPNEGFKIAISVKASFVDPWPNTELGGHEVHGGTLHVWKGEELKYVCDNIEWHVWRNENNEPRRIYAENENPPFGQDWEIGGPIPDYDNVAYENGEWVFTCFWQAASGVIQD